MIFRWGSNQNIAGQGSPLRLAWGSPSVWQGVPCGCCLFACLLAFGVATLLAMFKAFPSFIPQFWEVLEF